MDGRAVMTPEAGNGAAGLFASHVLMTLFNIGLIFGPHIGYVAQYAKILQTHNIDGYAPLVSLILLVSNTLRIYYFMGEPFALALLFQAILAVLVHVALLLKVLTVHADNLPPHLQGVDPGLAANGADEHGGVFGSPDDVEEEGNIVLPEDEINRQVLISTLFVFLESMERRLLAHTPPDFLYRYIVGAIGAFLAVLAYYGLMPHGAYAAVGYLALGIEAMLVVPQIVRNARRRSTEGLTIILIITWVAGDLIKVVYFVMASQPVPFIACGIFQIMLDIVVVGQWLQFRHSLPVG